MPKTKKTGRSKKDTTQDIKQLQQEINELKLKWQRAMADYQNLEKRFAQEKISLTKYLNAGLIEKLLTVMDDFERASRHIKDKGLIIVLNKLKSVLQSEGLSVIKAEKQSFDPITMDCVDLVKGPDNKVVSVVEKGYYLNGRVLRPAKVKVGKGE